MAGASLTIGLLSFSGILAIWPAVLPLAFGAFVLSVAYEGEIYLKNIKGSLKKLFKSNQIERQLAKSCLLEHCFLNNSEKNRPQFFKDYERQIYLLHRFEEKRLDKASSERKRHVEKTLGDMEKWFAQQLFSDSKGSTRYKEELRTWLDNKSLLAEFQAKRSSRSVIYQILKVFCSTAGVFMGLGTTYLLIEAFSVIPWLAALPVASLPMLIVPMAVIAGVAYGLLVYNAMTDMIASEMVTKWFKKISQDLSNPKKWWGGVGKICVLSVMFLITLALSLCTAGTWWTVAKTTPPLFSWMNKIPSFMMLVLNPLILSVSTWAFNLENVSETLEMAEPYVDAWLGEDKPTNEIQTPVLDEKCEGMWDGTVTFMLSDPTADDQTKITESKDIVFVRKHDQIEMWYCDPHNQCKKITVTNLKIVNLVKTYAQDSAQSSKITNTTHLKEIKTYVTASGMRTETWLQRLNPFRLFTDLVFDPLRKLLFLGHLASIGATADQVQGIPPILPAVLGAASEGVEDLHNFKLGKDAPHEHKHDLPSLLKKRLEADSGHNHGNDLPTICLTFLFSPFHLLAACWDFMFSRGSEKWDSLEAVGTAFMKSWNKETGTPEEETVEFAGVDPCCDKPAENSDVKDAPKQASPGLFDITSKKIKPKVLPIQAWQFEQAAYQVERHKEKCLQGAWVGSDIAEQQIEKLADLQQALHTKSDDALLGIPSRVDTLIKSHLNEPDYNKHRFFLYEPNGKTDTREFLEGLPARVAMAG